MHVQGGIKHSKCIPHLLIVVIPLGVYISWFLGTRIINEKSYQKLAFVFTHDIKTFEGYIKLSGLCPSSFICLLMF